MSGRSSKGTAAARRAPRRPGRRAAGAAWLMAGALVAVAPAVISGAGPAEAAARKPDLSITHTMPGSFEAEAGRRLGVRVVVANEGEAPAGPSRVTVYLSRDGSHSKGDRTLGTAEVRGMQEYQLSSVGVRGTVPDSYRGKYYVIACADTRRQVRESQEGDNCAASPAPVLVVKHLEGDFTGTLTFAASGQDADDYSTHDWSRSLTVEVSMKFTGVDLDQSSYSFRDDTSSSYEWTGLWSTEIHDDDCPVFTDRGEQGSGGYDEDQSTPQKIYVVPRNPRLTELIVGSDMEVHRNMTQSSCKGSDTWEDDIYPESNVTLVQTARTRTAITYKVKSWGGYPSEPPGGWDTVTGSLRLELD